MISQIDLRHLISRNKKIRNYRKKLLLIYISIDLVTLDMREIHQK